MNAKERTWIRGARVVAMSALLAGVLALSACGHKRVHQDFAPVFSPDIYDFVPRGCYSIDVPAPASEPDR